MPNPLHSQQEARTYLAQAFGTQREFQLHPFPHGWVVSPKPPETQTDHRQLLGQPKMVLDMRTRLILEFPSWPVQRVAQEYSRAIEAGTPLPGRQVYPPRTRMRLQLIREEPMSLEYRIQISSLENPDEPTSDYQLTVDKQTLQYRPPDHQSARATSWIAMRHNTDRTWPTQGTMEY